MAAVVSETKGFHADVPTLPDWKTVISSLTSPGCMLHFRRATGAYASKEYKLVYSDAAKEASKDWWWPLLYSVPAEVTRPTADGGTETLPKRVGIRALCLLPKSDQGTEEGVGAVKAILEALGIFELGEGSADASALAPEGEAPSWVLAALGWARSRLSPSPLSAAQGTEHRCTWKGAENCELEEIGVTITTTPISISCPAGFDFDWVGVGCSHTGFSPIDPGIGPSPPSGGSGPGDKGDGETGPRSVGFTLDCNSPVMRAEWGRCSVTTEDEGVNRSDIQYNWSAGSRSKAGKGSGFSSWGGVATASIEISVAISGEGIESVTLREPFRVNPRSSWGVASLSASIGYVRSGWPNLRWGLYSIPRSTPTVPSVAIGQGPWFGQFTAGRAPSVSSTFELHGDLASNGPKYGGATNLCSSTLPNRSNLYTVNDTCGTGGNWASFGSSIESHERGHEGSLNACLSSSKGAATMTTMESVLRTTAADASNAIQDEWADFYQRSFRPALEGQISSFTGPSMWEHRSASQWGLRQLPIQGHNGTHGC